METNITPELIEQAKKAESVEALLALAKENNVILTAEQAENLFAEWHTTRELSDDELDSVAGGCGEDGNICPECGEGTVEFDHIRYGRYTTYVVSKCNKCNFIFVV